MVTEVIVKDKVLDEFDWVAARFALSIPDTFASLVAAFERDAKRYQESKDRKWDLKIENRTDELYIGIIENALRYNWPEVVAVLIVMAPNKDGIQIRITEYDKGNNNYGYRDVTITTCVTDYGISGFMMDGEGPLHAWQVSRRSLEALFFSIATIQTF